MKNIMIITLLFSVVSLKAQVGKDTVKTDSSHIEKIKKMPMDTIHDKMPVKPVLPEEKKKKDEQPIARPSKEL